MDPMFNQQCLNDVLNLCLSDYRTLPELPNRCLHELLLGRLTHRRRKMKKMWSGVLVKPNGKIMAGRPTVKNATRFIAHLIGANISKDERNDLLEHIYGSVWRRHTLPDPIR